MKKMESKQTWKPIILQSLVTVAAAFIGGVLALTGNYFLQARQEHSQAVQADKAQRKEVYFNFLKSANAYNNTADDAKECLNNFAKHTNQDGTLNKYCTDRINQLITDRYNFQDTINQVFIFGSDNAVAASKKVAAELPASLGDLTVGPGLPTISQIQNFDKNAISKAYQEFNSLACHELPAIPRQACNIL